MVGESGCEGEWRGRDLVNVWSVCDFCESMIGSEGPVTCFCVQQLCPTSSSGKLETLTCCNVALTGASLREDFLT